VVKKVDEFTAIRWVFRMEEDGAPESRGPGVKISGEFLFNGSFPVRIILSVHNM
jgi:hypothetical protein